MKINLKNKQHIISIIVPVFNEEDNIDIFYKNLINHMKNSIFSKSFEVIFIDDGSDDKTLPKIKKIVKSDKSIKYVSFYKNQGINTTFSAGLDYATGDCMIFLDVDGQYPMTILDQFYENWVNGNKIVFAKEKIIRIIFYKLLTVLFVKFINYFSKIELRHDSSYVCLLDRTIIDLLKNMEENTRYYRD